MGILTKAAIVQGITNEDISIEPLIWKNIGPNSVDVTLGNRIAYYPFLKIDEDGNTERGETISIGQVSEEIRPEEYGHMCVVNPMSKDCQYRRELPLIDLAHYQDTYQEEIPESGFVLLPGNVYLVKVNEKIGSDKYIAEVGGLSSLSRAGLSIHKTAARANIGDTCQFVLEMEACYPTVIYPNMKIATVFFQTVEGEVTEKNKYDGRYQQDKDENPEIIRGYIPDKELVEKVAAFRKKQQEEEEKRQELLKKEQEAAAAKEAADKTEEAPAEEAISEVVTDAEVKEAQELPHPGDVIDMGDTIPGFQAEVVSAESTPSDEVVVEDKATDEVDH